MMKYRGVYLIAISGIVLNAFYFIYWYKKFGKEFIGHLLEIAPLEFALVLSTVPLGLLFASLYAEELRSAEKLKAALGVKDLFADIMRHDLLNSIGLIKGLSELMKDDPRFADVDDVDIIHRTAIKLEDQVKMAAKYAKLEALDKVELETVDVASMIDEAIESLRYQFSSKKITVENKIERGLMVKAAPYLKDVFYNILSNAAKYSPERGRVVIASEDSGEEVEILVKDEGPGVKDEYKEKIFQRFTRGGKEGVQGTGLGLAIAKRIIELHNGRIWVEDNWVENRDKEGQIHKKKQGSVFIVSIPKI
jgi:hypothetical protein